MRIQRRMFITLATVALLSAATIAPTAAARGHVGGFDVRIDLVGEAIVGEPATFRIDGHGTGSDVELYVVWGPTTEEEEGYYTFDEGSLPTTITQIFYEEGEVSAYYNFHDHASGQDIDGELYFVVVSEAPAFHPEIDVGPSTIEALAGDRVVFGVQVTDDGAGPIELSVGWGDGQFYRSVLQLPNYGFPYTHGFTLGHVYSEPGTYQVTFEIREHINSPQYAGSNVADYAHSTVIVHSVNEAPELSISDAAGDEDAAIAIPLDIIDPDSGDTHTLDVDYGDGNSESIATAAGAQSVSHVYADPGTYTVSATVTDAAGESASSTATITVANVIDSQAEAEAAYEELKAQYKADKDAMKERHKAEHDAAKAAHEAHHDAKDAMKERQKAEMDALDKKDKDGKKALKEQHEAEKDAWNDEHKAIKDAEHAMKDAQHAEKDALKDAYKAAVDELKPWLKDMPE